MRIGSFEGEINEELVKEIASFLNGEDQVIMYLYSLGGKVPSAEIIIDMINRNKERVHLIGIGILGSSAFRIFHKVQCKKELHPSCTGFWHQSTVKIDVNQNGKPDTNWDQHWYKVNRKAKKDTFDISKELNLNKKEMKRLKKGYDIYFSAKRMKQLFKL